MSENKEFKRLDMILVCDRPGMFLVVRLSTTGNRVVWRGDRKSCEGFIAEVATKLEAS